MTQVKKVLTSSTIQHVDFQTGEVKSETTSSVAKLPSEPPFVKMYIHVIGSISGIYDSDQALLRHLLSRLDYEGYVALTARSREAIANALDITPKTMRNRMNRLVQADLIRPIARNEYQVNPYYFARGEWKKICEQRDKYEGINMGVSVTNDGGVRINSTEAIERAPEEQKELPL